ncbi:MAG: MlaD family protein [Alphaproteobacteria bacterium]|nr:MlaD family protein [Alphaproteobacteria bacterium]
MRHIIETIVGIIVVASAVFLLSYAYSEHGHSEKGYTLIANVSEASGLSAGADVCVSGVKVGSVEAIKLNHDTYRACLVLRIADEVRLSSDTNLSVESRSLLGGKYVSLTPGYEDDVLPNGGQIMFTTGAVSFEKLLMGAFLKSNEPKVA